MMEKLEPFDSTMVNYFRNAPVSELITRARGDYVFLKLNATHDKVSVSGSQPRINKWTPVLRPRRDEVIEFLRSELAKDDEPESEREVEIILGDVSSCPSCGHVLVPAPDAQVEKVYLEQLCQSSYWQWTIDELNRLKNHLEPGDLIVCRYAHSVVIRNAAGQLRNYPKSQS